MKLTLSRFEAALWAEFGENGETLEHLLRAARDADAGLCLACGSWTYGVEPDAWHYLCETCRECKVFGIEDIALRLITQPPARRRGNPFPAHAGMNR